MTSKHTLTTETLSTIMVALGHSRNLYSSYLRENPKTELWERRVKEIDEAIQALYSTLEALPEPADTYTIEDHREDDKRTMTDESYSDAFNDQNEEG